MFYGSWKTNEIITELKGGFMTDWEDRKSLLKMMLAEIEADELAKQLKRGRPPLYTKEQAKERRRVQSNANWVKNGKKYNSNRPSRRKGV